MKGALPLGYLLGDEISKKPKLVEEQEHEESAFVKLDDDLLFEVLKHADALTLASVACVSKRWRNTAHDERLWEMLCTRHWANIGCGSDQLRSVVLALGGFRRLHTSFLWPLLKTKASPSHSLSTTPLPHKKECRRWGKDEVHLSLSLLSIRCYERMDSSYQVVRIGNANHIVQEFS